MTLTLYKYYAFTDFWETPFNGQFYLAHPSELNDPFEVKPIYNAKEDVKLTVQHQAQKRSLNQEQEKELLKKLLNNEEKYKEFFTARKKPFRLGCLSASHTNLLLWSYYTDKHKGFCVAFDVNTSLVKDQKPNYALTDLKASKCYRKDYPIVSLLNQSGEPLLGEQLFNDIFCSKSDQWAHEEEWRIVNKLTEDELNEYKGKGILRNLSDLGLEITTVYLGCNISAENKQVITAKVNALNSSRQIKIQQANISKTQYKLEFS